MKRYPIDRKTLITAMSIMAGVFWWGERLATLKWLVILLCSFVLLIFLIKKRWLLVAFIVIGFCGGALYMQHHLNMANGLDGYLEGIYANHRQVVTGKVTSAPIKKPYCDVLVGKIGDETLKQTSKLRVYYAYDEKVEPRVGQVISVPVQLNRPRQARNPGGFDERDYLYGKGIFCVAKASEPFVFLEQEGYWQIQLASLKTKMNQLLERGLSKNASTLMQSVLFGETVRLQDDFYSLAQQVGVVHIFAVSGLHVGFLMAFALALMRPFLHRRSPVLFLVLAFVLLTYVLMTGANAPSVRATIMSLVGFYLWQQLRYIDPWTVIGYAALCLIVVNPFVCWQIGFRLSFLVCLGILAIAPVFQTLFHRLPRFLANLLSVALAAELAGFPLVAYYFHMFTPLSVLMNLLIVPLIGLIVPVVFMALFLGLCHLPTMAVFWLAEQLINVLLVTMQTLGRPLAQTHFYVGMPSYVWVLLYLAGLFALAYYARVVCVKRKKNDLLKLSILAVLLLLLGFGAYKPADKALALTVVDVGQGSGATWQTADGSWLVFDTGPHADTVASYLRACGVNRVAGVVISHGDLDHIKGTAHILRDFKVQHLFISPMAWQSVEGQELWPYIGNTKVHLIENDLKIDLQETKLSLQLVDADQRTQNAQNNSHQVVAHLYEQGQQVLFTGDTNADALHEIKNEKPVDVVIVPHHGSKYSWDQSFYQRHQVRLALISAGQDNRFGHPAKEVVQGLSELNIPFESTQDNGALLFYRQKGTFIYESHLRD